MKRFAILAITLLAVLTFSGLAAADPEKPCDKPCDKPCMSKEMECKDGKPCDKPCMSKVMECKEGHDCKMQCKDGKSCDKPCCMTDKPCMDKDKPCKSGDMDDKPCKDGKGGGMMGGPGCGCEMCMKAGRLKGMDGGMMGPRGDVDDMTWPRMNRSCRTPDFYLDNAGALGVSDVQADSLEKLDESLKRDMIIKGAQVKALELGLSGIVTKTDFKYEDAVAKLKEIEKARTELRITVIKASSDARDVLGVEQLDRIKDMDMPGRACRTMPDGKPRMPGMGGMPEEMMKEKMMENMRERMMR
ncbi:MAG: hypothetical protein HZA22_08690 [Nitrospirae bacterium]|nr:hypothetical protein [Nitrospirota bacterium]